MKVHPLTQQMMDLINADPRAKTKIANAAGVNRRVFDAWVKGHHPLLFTMEAVLGSLGYKLEIERHDEQSTQTT